MACPRCAAFPDAHNFVYFGKKDNINLFYSSPARGHDYREVNETFSYYKAHLDTAKDSPWIWVIDCAGMKIKHYSSIGITKKVINVLTTEHKETLHKVWLVHPNTWARSFLATIKPFLKKEVIEKIHIFEGDKLELYVGLEKAGLKGNPLHWLLSVFAKPQEPGHLPPTIN